MPGRRRPRDERGLTWVGRRPNVPGMHPPPLPILRMKETELAKALGREGSWRPV
jgi:hypothetical protein